MAEGVIRPSPVAAGEGLGRRPSFSTEGLGLGVGLLSPRSRPNVGRGAGWVGAFRVWDGMRSRRLPRREATHPVEDLAEVVRDEVWLGARKVLVAEARWRKDCAHT